MFEKIRIIFRNGDEKIINKGEWDDYSYDGKFFVIKKNSAWVKLFNADEIHTFELVPDESSQGKTAENLSFSQAIEELKKGRKITRTGWNGKGMFLCFVGSKDWDIDENVHGTSVFLAPWIAMKTADGKLVPWIASQTDVLADDWKIKGE